MSQNYPAYLVVTPPPMDSADLQLLPPVDPQNMTVREAVERYLALRQEEGVVQPGSDHYRHLDRQLRRSFCCMFGKTPLGQVTSDDIRSWMRSIRTNRNGDAPPHPLTIRHYLKAVKPFFRRAHAEGWIPRDPAVAVMAPRVVDKPVNVLSAEQAFHCFKTNINHWAIYRLALEAFGGVRCSTAAKLSEANIKQEQKAIEMPGSIHKSQKRVFRQGQPSCLWAWLAEAPPDTWTGDWRAYRDAKQVMHLLAGLRKHLNRFRNRIDPEEDRRLRELKNVWRHSFATYMLALDGAYSRTQYLMQHTSAKTTTIYEGLATQEDARLYFSITPDAVRSMDWHEFKRWVLKPAPNAGLSVSDSPAQAAVMGFRWQTPAGAFIDYRAG